MEGDIDAQLDGDLHLSFHQRPLVFHRGLERCQGYPFVLGVRVCWNCIGICMLSRVIASTIARRLDISRLDILSASASALRVVRMQAFGTFWPSHPRPTVKSHFAYDPISFSSFFWGEQRSGMTHLTLSVFLQLEMTECPSLRLPEEVQMVSGPGDKVRASAVA